MKTILVFRLSSLGDLILASGFLENLPSGVTVDWVVSSDFAFVLRGHPKIRKIWVFEKKGGLLGWIRLLQEIDQVAYDARVDLHRNLRTAIAFSFFRFRDLFRAAKCPHFGISKQRIRTWGLLLLKRIYPRIALPEPYWMRFGRLAHSIFKTQGPIHPPSFLPQIQSSEKSEVNTLSRYGLTGGQYYSVMPSSRWASKEWGVDAFVELILRLKERGKVPLILGRSTDSSGVRLKNRLQQLAVPFKDALSESSFIETAILLKNSAFYVGCDTGLSHLAESVGCPAYVIFGPTRPELGFGPARSSSRALSAPIGCAPCSKDGKRCVRVWSPYECMRRLKPEQVEASIQK